jgi:hypothetical protein
MADTKDSRSLSWLFSEVICAILLIVVVSYAAYGLFYQNQLSEGLRRSFSH